MHEHGELDLSDIASSLEAMVIFQNMRTNLAMIMSFVRRSLPKDSNLEQYDIGLLNVPPGEAQLATHTRAVTCFLAALLSQCLDNYQKMKTVRPDLEHAGLEAVLDGLEDRCRFLSGLTRVRNAVFHVNDLKAWRHPDVEFLAPRLGATRDVPGGPGDPVESPLCLHSEVLPRRTADPTPLRISTGGGITHTGTERETGSRRHRCRGI